MELQTLLAGSAAVEDFKHDVIRFRESRQARRVVIQGYAPPVKVERLLHQLLAAESAVPIERVVVRGRSGCSDFAGTVTVETASETRQIDFVWDCRWRAEQEGWTDCFGFPDQMRAAREFGWRCFSVWRESAAAPTAETTSLAGAGAQLA